MHQHSSIVGSVGGGDLGWEAMSISTCNCRWQWLGVRKRKVGVFAGWTKKGSGGRKKNNNNIGSLPTEERQGLTYSSVARQKVASA